MGEQAGHEFHGNQWVSAGITQGKKDAETIYRKQFAGPKSPAQHAEETAQFFDKLAAEQLADKTLSYELKVNASDYSRGRAIGLRAYAGKPPANFKAWTQHTPGTAKALAAYRRQGGK